MSDILLSVGLQKGSAETSQIQADLQSIISRIDKNPPKVKVGLQVDQSAINHFKSQLTQIVNSVGLSKGAPITVNISGIGEITTKAGQAKKALDGVAKAGKEAAAAVNNMGTTQAQKALTQINSQLKTIQSNYAKWTAAATGQSSASYAEYGNQIRALEALKLQVEANVISWTEFQERLGAIKLAASEAATAINKVGENRSAEKVTVLEHNTEEYRKALAQCNSELVNLRKNQEKWTAAKNGRGASDYAALSQYEKQVESLIADLSTGKMTMDEFRQRFGAIKASADNSRAAIRGFGEDTKSLGDRLKGLAAKFGAWLSVSQVIMQAIRAIKQMVTAVREVDAAMTELKKVTNETDAAYSKFLSNASTRAKQIGASLSDVVNASADFARLGYGLEDAAKLADAALIYKNIGDGIEDISMASESIISTMQAFGIEASNVMSIVDKFNEVGNNFAISSAGIGDAMQRSAAAMAAANNTIDETIALITAANTIVQNPDSVGTALKTVSMYLRAAKTEAEEAGESTEGMANSVSELRESILRLTGQRVDIQIDEDTFKSTYQILKELSQVWDSLTDISQANLLEMIGGKRNSNVVAALLENFTVAENSLKTSAEAAGSAIAENEKHLESIAGKIDKFKASFQTFSTEFIDSALVKGVVDFGTTLMDILTGVVNVVEALGGFKTVLLATAAALMLANNGLVAYKIAMLAVAAVQKIVTFFSGLKAAIMSIVNVIPAAIAAWQGYAAGTVAASAAMQASIPVIGLVLAALTALVGGISLYKSATADAAESTDETKKSLSELGEELSQLKSKVDGVVSEFRDIRDSTADILPRLLELANGVDKFGNNVSLTDAEYAEFVGLNNRIAEMFPELNMGFDSNGNAMLALSYSADTLTTSLNNLVEAQRAAANAEIAATMPDVVNTIVQTNEEYEKQIDKVERMKERYQDVYDTFVKYRTNVEGASPDAFLDADYAEAVAEMYELMTGKSADLTYYERYTPWWDLAEQERFREVEDGEGDYAWIENRAEILAYFAEQSNEDVKAALDAMLVGQDKLIADYQERMRASWAGVNPIVSAWLETDFLYNDLNDGMQQIAKIMASGLDFSSLGLTTAEQVQDYIQNGILLPMFNAAPEVKEAFSDITDWSNQLKNGEITADEFSSRVSSAFDALKGSMSAKEFSSFSSMFVAGMKLINPEVTDFDSAVRTLAESWGYTTDAVAMSSNVFANVADKVSTVKTKLDTLTGALDALSEGSLEVWDVIDLLQQFPELAEYVDLTADNFGNLDEGLEKLIRNTPDEFVKTMQEFKETNNLTGDAAEHIDSLCAAVQDLSNESLKDITGEFGILAEQIKAATAAQNELEAALAEDDWDAGYEGRVEAFEGFQETFDAGEYGSKAYAAYKEYFGLMEKTPEQVKAWMDSNKKYFTEGTDGILKFLQTVESLSGPGGALEGIASFDSETGAFWYDINQLRAFADELGWTEEMLQDFIYKYRMYVDEWTSRSAQDNLTEFSNAGLVFDIGDETFASLEKLIEYTGLSKEEVQGLVTAMNELREQQGLDPIQLIGSDQITITQATVDNLLTAGATAEDVKALLLELAGQDNVTIEAGITLDGQTVEEMISAATGDGTEAVSVDITMTVNDEEVIATVTTTAEQIQAILGDGWEAKISADATDAEGKLTAVDTLLANLPEDTLVTVSDSTYGVRSNLLSVKNYLQYISNNATKTITVRYRTIGSPVAVNATGTRHATRGPSLLGDEYSPDGSPKPELVVSNGRAYLAGQSGPEIGYLNEGDIVYNATETKRILRGNILHSSIQAHAGGTAGGLKDTGGLKSGGGYNFSSGSGSSSSSSSSSSKEEESWFEKQYKYHQHLLEMDQESVEDYLKWLDEAYQKAFDEGVIDQDEYYKYQEEVYHGLQDLFKDYLNDIDHEISMLEGAVGSSDEVIALAEQAMSDIEDELAAARAAGLDENSEYIQYLEQQWKGYSDTVTDLREQAETEAKNSVDDLVDYRVEMLKQEIEDEKEALNKKLKALQEFYDEQRKMLQDQYDEEKYLEEQKEKRKAVSDIDAELAMLEHDDSAWAQKRKLELQEERANAAKELSDFERDHALDVTLDMLDEQQAAQEAQIQAEMDALDERLNDPHALFNQALNDIKNNTAELYQEFIEYNRKHGTGNDEDIEEMWEEAYIADQEYKDTHDGESQDGIEIGNYTGYVPPETPQPPAPTEPTEPQTPPTTTPTEEETKPSLAKGSSIQVKKSATHFSSKSGGVRMASFVPGGTYTVYQTSGNEVLIGRKGVYTGWIKKSDIVGYASGTSNASAGLHGVDEIGTEYIFESADGSRYRMFHGGEKVLTAEATNFLYNFANTGGSVLAKMIADLFKSSGLGNVSKPIQAIEVHSGDIIVQGNATAKTVSEIRRAQRENLEFVLKELNKLNK